MRAEKSTLLPMRLPLSRPSFPFRRALIALIGLPVLCLCVAVPYISLSMTDAVKNYRTALASWIDISLLPVLRSFVISLFYLIICL